MNFDLPVIDTPQLLKETRSRCPVCHAAVPGAVFRRSGKVYLKRMCPEHGELSVCIASDERFYHLSRGRSSCSSSEGEAASDPRDPFDVLSTCLALIEIVDSCNLACPTCYADSPASKSIDCITLEEFQTRISGVIARKGDIEILQLSGGEPTLHPQFFEILEWAQEHPQIGYVIVNTNGVLLAQDEKFAAALDRRYRRGKVQLYLQYDGPGEDGQRELRGADLREVRARAIEVAGSLDGGGLPVTLAMTVTPQNLDSLWATIEFGLRYRHVRGVTFQPLFGSGRVASAESTDDPTKRLSTADIILQAVEQSAGQLRYEDFTPLPCGDPNCATIGYLLRMADGVHSISEYLDLERLSGFLQNRVDYNLDDLSRCGCESEPLGQLLHTFELAEEHTFRLFIKPFMDAWTWDEDRIDRCCTHVIRPDGQLDSFCRYYSGFPECEASTSRQAKR